ncbi:hypothetical protein RIEGSTA812A_PEG_631 [invertebrate metagenome]|uniref:Uncharacterized protein n=1 Tax=invertebrate metagenome TaxID=1711999 RepID=A0A484HAL1_9ZZZZ
MHTLSTSKTRNVLWPCLHGHNTGHSVKHFTPPGQEIFGRLC